MAKENGTGCSLGAENKARLDSLESSDIRQWDVIEKVRERLPNWAVFAMNGLVAVLAATITIIVVKIV